LTDAHLRVVIEVTWTVSAMSQFHASQQAWTMSS
jgi:hypothetical protein